MFWGRSRPINFNLRPEVPRTAGNETLEPRFDLRGPGKFPYVFRPEIADLMLKMADKCGNFAKSLVMKFNLQYVG